MANSDRKHAPDDQADEAVTVVPNPASTKRSQAALNSKGHDERGRYGKGTGTPAKSDTYTNQH